MKEHKRKKRKIYNISKIKKIRKTYRAESLADRKNIVLLDLLNESYHYHKNLILEDDLGLKIAEARRLLYSKRSVARIDYTISLLPNIDKLIIEAELIHSKRGTKWYQAYFTDATYYRNRKHAYKLFIDLVNK